MPRGGARPGSGRKPGSETKRTREIVNGVAKSGLTPLQYLLNVLANPEVDQRRRGLGRRRQRRRMFTRE